MGASHGWLWGSVWLTSRRVLGSLGNEVHAFVWPDSVADLSYGDGVGTTLSARHGSNDGSDGATEEGGGGDGGAEAIAVAGSILVKNVFE